MTWKTGLTAVLAALVMISAVTPAHAAAVEDIDPYSLAERLAEEMKSAKTEVPFTGCFLICATGTAAEMEAALKKGCDPNGRDPAHDGMPALTVAAANKPDPGVVTALLKAGADIDVRGEVYGRTALHVAVLFNPRPEVIKALLAGQPDLEIPDKLMETALSYAIKGKIKGDFFVGYPDDEIILPLLEATTKIPAKSILKERRVDYYAFYMEEYRNAFKPRYADTPDPSDEVLAAFHALGVPEDSEDERKAQFQEAARYLDLKAMKRLLAAGKVPATLDDDGNGLLHYVMRGADGGKAREFKAMLDLVLAAKVEPDPKNNRGETPLHSFGRWARVADEDEVQALLPILRDYIARGIDLEARDERGYTPIFGVTATLGLPEYKLRLMYLLGCDVNARDNMGMTPLIHEGAGFYNFRESDAGESKGEWLVANFTAFLTTGADPYIRDNEGKTAFDHLSPAARKHFAASPMGWKFEDL